MKDRREKTGDCESLICPVLEAIENPSRKNDPVPKHEIENIRDYLLQVGNHELVLTNMAEKLNEGAEKMEKNRKDIKEIKASLSDLKTVVEPVTESITSIHKLVKVLEPVAKIAKWLTAIGVSFTGMYLAYSEWLKYLKGHH